MPTTSLFVRDVMAEVRAKNPTEAEFHQAVEEVLESLDLVLSGGRNTGPPRSSSGWSNPSAS